MSRRCTYKACENDAQVTVVIKDPINEHNTKRHPMCRSHAWDVSGKPLVTLERLETENDD